jgi:hypothetical protein
LSAADAAGAGAQPGAAVDRASASDRHGSSDSAAPRLAAIAFAMTVLATFLALGVTQWLKHAPTAVQQLEISPATLTPGANGEAGTEHIEFHIQHSDRIDVGVIDSRGRTVRALASGRWLHGYKRLTLAWDGRLASGGYARAGDYRLRIYLERRKREVVSPVSFQVRRARSSS